MIEPDLGEYEGLPAMRRFAAEVGEWPEQVEDWQWCARFTYQMIERRGSGGGAFRAMYSRFLEEAGRADAARACAQAADGWTKLAGTFFELSEKDAADGREWAAAGREATALLAVEEKLWESLS